MSALGSLVVKLALEYAQFSKGLNDSEQDVKKHAKRVQDAYEKMAGGIDRRVTSLRNKLVGAFAGAISVAGFLSSINKVRAETIAAEQEQAQLAAVLRSTGEAAGWSQARLNEMADALERKSTYSAGAITEAQTRLLSYSNIAGNEFPRAMQAVLDMSARMGVGVTSSAETIGRALDVPSEGLSALSKQGFRFTEAQKEMVLQLERTGQVAKAQGVVLDVLESSYGGAAEAARNTFGGALEAVQNTLDGLMTPDGPSVVGLTNSVNELNELLRAESTKQAFAFYIDLLISGATDAAKFAKAIVDLKNIGFGAILAHATSDNAASELVDIERKIADLTKTRDSLASNAVSRFFNADDILIANKQLDLMGQQRTVLLDYVNQGIDSYDAFNEVLEETAAVSVSVQEPLAKSDEWVRRFGTTTQKAALDVAEWKRKLGDGFTPAMQVEVEAYWAKQDAGAKAGAQSVKQLAQAYSSLKNSIAEKTSTLQQELFSGEKLTESEKLRIKYQQDLKNSLSGLSAEKRQSIEADIAAYAWLEKEVVARKALAQAIEEEGKHRQEWWAGQARAVEDLEAGNKQMRDEIVLIGLSEDAQYAINRARLEAQITVKEQHLAELQRANDAHGFMSREQIALEQQIDLLRERLVLLDDKKVRDANAKAQDQIVKDWERTSQTIGGTLADYIMGGGKDAAQYLKRLFATLVLQPIVQAGVGSVLGVAGMGSQVSGGSGVGNAMGTANNLSSLYSAFSGGLVSSVGGAIGSLGATFGSSALTSFAAGMKGSTLAAGLAGPTTAGASGAMGLGATFGAALPWVAGGLAIASLFGGLFGGGRTWKGGEAYAVGGDDYAITTRTLSKEDFLPEVANALGPYVQTISKVMSDTLGDAVYVGAAFQDSGKGADAYFRLASAAAGFNYFGDVGVSGGQEGAEQTVALTAQKAIDLMLESGKLSELEMRLFSAAAQEGTFDGLVAAYESVKQINSVFKSLGETMASFAGISDQMQVALLDAAGSIENLTSIAGSYYAAVYSEQERMEAAAKQMNATLAGLGIFAERGGIDVLGDNATAKLRQAVDELMAAGNAGVAAQLMAMGQSFAEVANWGAAAAKSAAEAAKKAADDARQSLIDAAWRNLEAAVDRESELIEQRLSAVQQSIDTLTGMQSMLKSNADALYGNVDSTAQMRGIEGMLYVESALDAVRRGTSIEGFDKLSDAVTAARGGLSSGVYASQFEKDRDALVLAGQLSELEGAADLQLSVEERQLKVLNEQLSNYQLMLDTAREMIDGIDALIDKTLTPQSAYDVLMRVLKGESASQSGSSIDYGGASWGGGSGAATGTAVDPYASKYVRDTWLYEGYFTKRGTDDARLDPLAELIKGYSGTGDVAGMLNAAKSAGYTLSDVQAAASGAEDVYRYSTYLDWLNAAKQAGIPKFDVGTNRVPRDMLAMVHKDEAIVPKAFNPWADGRSMGGDNAALVAVVRALHAEVVALRAANERTASNTAGVPQLVEQFDNVTEGGNAMRVEVMA